MARGNLMVPPEREEYSLGSAVVKAARKVKSKLGADLEDAKTATGEKSKGVRKREDGSIYSIMGDDALRIKGNIDQYKGGAKGALLAIPVTALLSSWLQENEEPPTKEEASAFEKAFSAAHNAGEDTFEFEGKIYTTEVRKGLYGGGNLDQSYIHPMDDDIRAEAAKLEQRLIDGEELTDIEQEKVNEYRRQIELEEQAARDRNRERKQEGGPMLLPPELSSEVPVDTYTPEDQANAEETQLPDEEMEKNYIDFILSEALDSEEQNYLMDALEADPQLSQIFDKVVDTAAEFSGEGEVEGPGTGVSDSIPARLSDGEFVMTQKATEQIGADNLQSLMDEAERAYDGGLQRMKYAFGGIVDSDEEELLEDEDEEIKKQMLSANQMPSVKG